MAEGPFGTAVSPMPRKRHRTVPRPAVSVVILVAGEPKLLAAAIDSVRAQSFADWELILVDSQSSWDATLLAIQQAELMSPQVRYVRHHGGYAAGIRLATGKYIAFLDPLDTWLPEKLSRQIELFKQSPHAAAVLTETDACTEVPGETTAAWPLASDSLIRREALRRKGSSGAAALNRRTDDTVVVSRESWVHPGTVHGAQREDIHYRNWHFRVAGTSDAQLTVGSAGPESVRISVKEFEVEAAWNVQLNLKRQTVRAGEAYRVSFDAKADATRSLSVGVSMAHEPWSGLGLYCVVEVGTDWERYGLAFVASRDDDDARIHFDLGCASAAVEFSAVGLFLQDGSPAPCGVQFGDLRRLTPISRMWGIDRGIPIDRYYIEKFLDTHSADIQGRVLEIGDNFYTRKFGGERVIASDILHVAQGNPKATIIGDIANAPHIPDESFDCIVFTQTLQFIYDVRGAIETLHRILRPGGVLLATLPGISPNNDRDWSDSWFWTFTPHGARRLFAESFHANNLSIETFGNVLTAISFLHGLSVGELTTEEFDYADRGYEVSIGVRATRRARQAAAISADKDPSAATGQAVILMYHRINEPGSDPFSLCVSPENFALQMDVLKSSYNLIKLSDLGQAVRSGHIPDRSVVITFDDGYADNLTIASPLLEERGLPATIFVATGNTGAPREFWWDELQRIFLTAGSLPSLVALTIQGTAYQWDLDSARGYTAEECDLHRNWRWTDEPPTRRHLLYLTIWKLLRPLHDDDRRRAMDQLLEWSGLSGQRETFRSMTEAELVDLTRRGLVEIGAHTVHHPELHTLAPSIQQEEIAASKRRIEEITGSRVRSFAYPFGSTSEESPGIVAEQGFEQACTTVSTSVRAGADCLRLPRVQVENWDRVAFAERLRHLFETESERLAVESVH